MDHDSERLFEFIMAHEHPTGELFRAALKAMPDLAGLIHDHFREWVWMDWHQEHDPYIETEADIAEREAWVEKSMMRFWEKLAEMKGTLSEPGKC